MNARLRWVAGALAALAAGCETTGDPQQGGLFGWSESKARERQAAKRAAVAGAETQLSRDLRDGETLTSRRTRTEQQLATTNRRRSSELDQLREQESALLRKTQQLEELSPTAATASRARAYRLKVSTVAAQNSLTPRQRSARLRALEGEIDATQARLTR
ncbi:MAG TPA: hypothetical protein VF593_01175 [Chthoniobacteraceae bacterium]